ncbi:MAG: hypothetical protein J6S29_04555, partial [Methanosphaera sp.]|nr:hypothetical protein [Methanosphaera sp.]
MNYNTNIKQEHQKIVTDVLNKDDDIESLKAIDEISNEEVLAIIACHADNGKIAEKCIDNIHDDYLLYNIIIDDVDLKTIEYAIGKIKNRNLLINLFNNLDDIDMSLARIIMEKMEDCNMLIDIILGDDYASDIKLTALDRVSNKDAFLLKDVLLNVDNPDIIEACCKRINDEYFLYTMLPDTDFFLSKSEAIRYEYIINFINDKHLLSHILENNNNEHIQEFVKYKLDILSNQDKKSGSHEFITRKFRDDRLKERYESCFIHDDFNM